MSVDPGVKRNGGGREVPHSDLADRRLASDDEIPVIGIGQVPENHAHVSWAWIQSR